MVYLQNTKKLIEIIPFLSEGIVIKTKDLTYQACSRSLLDLMQLSSESDIIGKTDFLLFDNQVLAEQIQHDDRAALVSGITNSSFYSLPIQAKQQSVEYRRQFIFDDDGEIESLLIFITEVDDSTKMQWGEQNIMAIFRHLPCHVYLKDKEGAYLQANDCQAQAVGWQNGEDIIGKTDYDIYPEEIAEKFVENDLKAMYLNKLIQTKEVSVHADGKSYVFLSNKLPFYDKNGENIIGVLGISFDITEQEQAKKQTEIYLENLISHLPGHIYWKDKKGRFLGCNNLQAKSAGFNSPDEMIGKTDFEMPWREQAELYQENDNQVINTGKAVFFEEESTLKAGEKRTFLANKVPLLDDKGDIIGVLGISTDITNIKQIQLELHKQKEKAEVANRLKTDFMRNMEHDLRTPTSGMLGLSKHLWLEETDPFKKENLGYVVQSAEELLNYCNGILDFDRIEAGMSVILEKKFRADQLVERVINFEQAAAKHKDLKLTLKHDQQIPKVLMGDNERLYSILLNLLSNSIKFTSKGIVELETQLVKKKKKQVIIRFIVRDTGTGIEQAQQAFIFEKFARISSSNKGFHKGLGLGLQVVKRFMHDLGGEIELDSKPGEGTEFICTIPFKLPLTQDCLDNTV